MFSNSPVPMAFGSIGEVVVSKDVLSVSDIIGCSLMLVVSLNVYFVKVFSSGGVWRRWIR